MEVSQETKDNVSQLASDLREVIWKDNRCPSLFELVSAMALITYIALKEVGQLDKCKETADVFSDILEQLREKHK